MASALGTAYVDIEAKTDKLQRSIARQTTGKFGPVGALMGGEMMTGVEGGIEQGGGGLKAKLGGLLGSAKGLIAGAGIAAAGMAAFSFIKGTIGAASDLEESLNAVGLVFGDTAGQITGFGEKAATEVGLSQTAFQGLATTTGALLKNKGIEDFTGKTIQLTERAADMASVFNTDVETAMGAIQSAIKGEFNPLEQFGVSLNAAAIAERALADTGKETASELTDQEKAAAALALVLDQTADTAGDFANTSGGLANSQRILSAEWENGKAKLGQALMPAMTKLAGIAGKVLPPLIEALTPIFEVLGDVVEIVADIFAEVLPPAMEALKPVFEIIGKVIKVWAEIFKTEVGIVVEIAKGVIDFFTAVFQGRWGDAWKAIKRIFMAPWNGIKDLIKRFPDVFTGLPGRLKTIGGNIVNAIINALLWLPRKAADVARNFASSMTDRIRALPGQMRTLGANIIQGLINGVKSMASRVGAAFKDAVMKPINAVKSFLHIGSPSRLMEQWGSWTGEGFAIGLEDQADQIKTAYDGLLPSNAIAATIDVAHTAAAATRAASSATTTADPTLPGMAVHVTTNGPVGGSIGSFAREIAEQGALELRFASA